MIPPFLSSALCAYPLSIGSTPSSHFLSVGLPREKDWVNEYQEINRPRPFQYHSILCGPLTFSCEIEQQKPLSAPVAVPSLTHRLFPCSLGNLPFEWNTYWQFVFWKFLYLPSASLCHCCFVV